MCHLSGKRCMPHHPGLHTLLIAQARELPPVQSIGTHERGRSLLRACREESDPRYITSAADIKLRSFSTKVRLPEFHCALTLST